MFNLFIAIVLISTEYNYSLLHYLLNLKNINAYLLLSFSLITSNTRHLQGTTYRNNILPDTKILTLTKINFILFLYSNLFYFNLIDKTNLFYNYFFLFYLPYYIDFPEFTGKRKICLNNIFLKKIAKFFKLIGNYNIINKYDIIDKNQTPYLITIHPHGLFPIGTLGCFGLPLCDNINKTIPLLYNKNDCYVGIASFCFYIPLVREFFLMLGAIDCSKPVLKKLFENKKSIFLFIGGAEEAKYSDLGNTNLIIKKRKGIFELALQYKLTIIPCYTFGNNNIYKSYNFDILNIFYYFKKITGIWFPRGKILFNKTDYYTVLGKPIKPNRESSYENNDILNLQEKYIKNLVDCFDENKYLDRYVENKNLIIN